MAGYDVLVVGGGVNGCGIARDAAGRGHRVLLVERADLAGATSSASTKLIHGGLRYLEHYAFRLVREALLEREVLLRAAPHVVWPLRFVLPHHPGMRPRWLLQLGLWLYDHLGGRRVLPPTRALGLRVDPAGADLQPTFARAFEYSDCWVEDARLVVLNAMDAAAHGAEICVRTAVVGARRAGGRWEVDLVDDATGTARKVTAAALVNATGPWVGTFARDVLGMDTAAPVRLVQGSHVVVRRLFDHDRAYIFQQGDGRIVFAIPYETDFTLIGTTDLDYTGDPAKVEVAPAEVDYLCQAANRYFRKPVRTDDVVWSFSGVRPLYDDGASDAQRATRDYVLQLDGGPEAAPVLHVIGGKITTYRRLAEAVVARLAPFLPAARGPWTAKAALPGGDFPVDGFPRLVDGLARAYPFLAAGQLRRLARAYGTLVPELLGEARRSEDLGRDFGSGLSEREVRWLVTREWARTAEDVVWRRSKLGLRLTMAEVAALDAYMAAGGRAAQAVA